MLHLLNSLSPKIMIMKLSPLGNEFLRILRNPKFQYGIHKHVPVFLSLRFTDPFQNI